MTWADRNREKDARSRGSARASSGITGSAGFASRRRASEASVADAAPPSTPSANVSVAELRANLAAVEAECVELREQGWQLDDATAARLGELHTELRLAELGKRPVEKGSGESGRRSRRK